jgi:hypothetical protein
MGMNLNNKLLIEKGIFTKEELWGDSEGGESRGKRKKKGT